MNFRNIILLLVSLLIIFLGLTRIKDNSMPSLEGKSIFQILKEIPKNDRDNLEYFFLTCITWEPFGYVLFGDKPMAFDGYTKKLRLFEDLSQFIYALSPRRIKYERAVKTWKNYEKLFPMKRFAFIWEESSEKLTYYLVNKKSFCDKVQEHQADFEIVFNRKVSGEEILQEAVHRPMLSDVLFDHDGLIGTLLGFGRDNAFLYMQRSQFKTDKEMDVFDKKFNFGYPWEKENKNFFQMMRSIGWINIFITGNHLKNLELNTLPGFMAILDHPETARLKNHYLQTREKMIQFYKDKDFLEETLNLLTSAG